MAHVVPLSYWGGFWMSSFSVIFQAVNCADREDGLQF